MPYAEVVDFKGGVDRRRPAVAGEPGKLYIGENIHISRGGDIEGRKKFVPAYTLPSGTFGFHALRSKFYVFGSAVAPSGLPADFIYQRLQSPTAAAMTAILSSDSFNGKVYAVAKYADGSVYHFYDGKRVVQWETLAASIANIDTVALNLAEQIDGLDDFFASAVDDVVTITAANPGTAFTISRTVSGGASATISELQANQAGVAETVATGTITVTGGAAAASNYIDLLTIDGVTIFDTAIFWTLSNDATADLIRDAINDADKGYVATTAGAVVTISAAPGTGATPNGYAVATTVHGIMTVTDADFSGGVDAVEAMAQIEQVTLGGYGVSASWTLTLDGNPYLTIGLASGVGTLAFTYKSKMFSAITSLLSFSAVNTPESVQDPVGASPAGLVASTMPASAGNLTLITGQMDVPRNVTITSDADDSGHTFTVTGTDRYGAAQTEAISGPNATTKQG
ncbi:MAG TPA: hypothetical protein VKA19_05360, partial [Alphaproteobacteria bacterium]|nr:hypothetical protein [Alphaproteobacteria bacterium]